MQYILEMFSYWTSLLSIPRPLQENFFHMFNGEYRPTHIYKGQPEIWGPPKKTSAA